MINSFRLSFFVLLALSFITFNASAADSSVEEIVREESELKHWWHKNPCLVMLSDEFQYNRDNGIPYKLTHWGGKKGLKKVAENKIAQSLDDEGLKWRKSCPGKLHTWSTDICRGIKELSRNPFYLSYADLYAFYHVKDQLIKGTSMASLWEELFSEKKVEQSTDT